MFEHYLQLWQLTATDKPIIRHSSQLLPVVLANGVPAMLKIALEQEEILGNALMVWWEGKGAAQVFAHQANALLLEKAQDKQSLLTMATNGLDDQATAIICQVINQLHSPRNKPFPNELIPLKKWFKALEPIAKKYNGIFDICLKIANELVNHQQDIVVLHGDIHHRNILDFAERGWLVIDPKGLIGERSFDYANLLCTPELTTANNPHRFMRQLDNIVNFSGLDRQRLLKWVVAYAGLSAVWFVEDEKIAKAKLVTHIAKLALQQLEPHY